MVGLLPLSYLQLVRFIHSHLEEKMHTVGQTCALLGGPTASSSACPQQHKTHSTIITLTRRLTDGTQQAKTSAPVAVCDWYDTIKMMAMLLIALNGCCIKHIAHHLFDGIAGQIHNMYCLGESGQILWLRLWSCSGDPSGTFSIPVIKIVEKAGNNHSHLSSTGWALCNVRQCVGLAVSSDTSSAPGHQH